MNELQKILVSIDVMDSDVRDGNLPARVRCAVREACWMCEATGARLAVMTVIEATDEPDVRGAAESLLESLTRPLLGDTQAELSVAVGTPFIEIIRAVRERDIDMVVVGSRQPTLFDRAIVGSTSMRLLRKCPCSVWVTTRRAQPGPWSVLSAVGSSGLAPDILDFSARIVAHRGGEWHVMHCVEYPQEGAMRLRHCPQDEIDAYRRGVREEDWSQLKAMTEDVTESRGIKATLWLGAGNPAERITLAIEEQDVHLVVMGTVGRSGLPGVLVGNVAEKVFSHVDCSILALKPEGFASPVE